MCEFHFFVVLKIFNLYFCFVFCSLKNELVKVTNEKDEMHKHYIMVRVYFES